MNGERSLEAKLAPTNTQYSLDELKEGTEIHFVDANKNMHFFAGKVDDHVIEMKQFLPRSTIIKNSKDVIAVVVFTGTETKITLNQSDYEFKLSDLNNKFNNFLVSQVFVFAAAIILSAQWGNRSGLNYLRDHHYIFPEEDPSD